MPGISIYLDALRQARLSQVISRPRRLLPPRVLALGPPTSSDEIRPLAPGAGIDRAAQSGPQPAPHRTSAFNAFGSSRPFPAEGFWRDDADGLLFLFHLHGFSELAGYAAGERSDEGDSFWSAVLRSWLAECDAPRNPAWHPYPLSGRVISWCSALSVGGWGSGLAGEMAASMRVQVRMLRRSIERDIGGNHVIRNASALAIGGACLGDDRAKGLGLRVLRRELPRQILSDGGHFERSPSYHRAVLADLDDVEAVLARDDLQAGDRLGGHPARMRAWMAAIAGPDGALPLFNDAWAGPEVEGDGRSVNDLSASGYVVLRSGDDQAVLDVGPLGPPHLPAHSHADSLSFVLWADGSPVVADPGSCAYTGPVRDRLRGTAAHSTVTIDGSDQCVLWGDFRASLMPRVERLLFEDRDGVIVVAAEHDGYRRLPDPVRHRRTFCWLPGEGLVVADRLVARKHHLVATRLPLASGARFDAGRIGPLALTVLGPGPDVTLEGGLHSDHLGQAVETTVVAREMEVAPGAVFGWALLREGAEAQIDGDRLLIRSRHRAPLALDPA